MLARRTDLALEQDNHSRFLPWLIAFMVFLAALAMAGTLTLNGMMSHWDRGMSGTLTVQLPAAEQSQQKKEFIESAITILRAIPGVARAEAVTPTEMVRLLEPWLGQTSVTSDLPLPVLIDVELEPNTKVDIQVLSQRLKSAVPGASVDDHRVWLDRFLRLIHTVQVVAILILILICLATVGTVIFTTRTGLAVHQEAIEVLHLIGAKDSYIARQFATRALTLGLRGGLIGLAIAIPTLLFIGALSTAMDAGLIPNFSMHFVHWLVIGSLPLFAALLAMFTARVTVLKSLSRLL